MLYGRNRHNIAKKLICIVSRRVLEYFLSRDTYRLAVNFVFYYYSRCSRCIFEIPMIYVNTRCWESYSYFVPSRRNLGIRLLGSTNEKLLLLRVKSCHARWISKYFLLLYLSYRRDGNTHSFFFFTHSIKGDIRLRKFIRERYDDFPFARNFVHGPTILIKRTLSESSISFSSVNPSMILDLRLPRGKSILINIRNRSIETVQQLSSARSTPVSIVESHC